MSDTASQTVPSTTAQLEVNVTVVHPNGRLENVVLSGPDGDRFVKIRLLLGARSVQATEIEDQDGPAAIAWFDGNAERKALTKNEIVSTLVEHSVAGPAVITGLGQGNESSISSIHDGLRVVLDRMAREGSS